MANDDDGSGCVIIAILLFFLASSCSKLDRIEYKLDSIERQVQDITP